MTISRRDAMFRSLCVVLAPLFALTPLPSRAFFWVFIRLAFSFSVRRGMAGAIGRGALGAAGRGAASAGARRAVLSNAGASTVTRTTSRGALSPAATKTRLQTARRAAPAAVAGSSGSSGSAARGAMPVKHRTGTDGGGVDLPSLAFHAASMLDAGEDPESAQVHGPVDLIELEIEGLNESDLPANGVLSVLIFDQAFADGDEGLFAREVLGVVVAEPNARLSFVHELEVAGLGAGQWYFVPSVTSVDEDIDLKHFAFEPNTLCVNVS